MKTERHEIESWRDTSDVSGDLRVHAIHSFTNVHGPGNRFSVWLQGCLKRCPGCSNQAMLPLESVSQQMISPEQLVADFVKARNSVLNPEGVTIQGGEPFVQAKALSKFLQKLKAADSEVNILLFTGYLLENLRHSVSEDVQSILSLCDTIIDGPFEVGQLDNNLVRGSTNQRLNHETPVLETRDFGRKGREHSFSSGSSEIIETGIKITH